MGSAMVKAIVGNSGRWLESNLFLKKIAIHHLAGTLFGDFFERGDSIALSNWMKLQILKQLPAGIVDEIFAYFPDEFKNSNSSEVAILLQKRKENSNILK